MAIDSKQSSRSLNNRLCPQAAPFARADVCTFAPGPTLWRANQSEPWAIKTKAPTRSSPHPPIDLTGPHQIITGAPAGARSPLNPQRSLDIARWQGAALNSTSEIMSMKSLDQLLLSPRICAADWLILQSHDLSSLARASGSTNLLVFSCLEARNAIEQLWFELLMVIQGGSMSKDLFEKCRSRRDGYLAAIGEAEPKYRLLAQFTALCMRLHQGAPCDVIVWDLGRLKKLWHALSGYCHAQAHPAATLDDPNWFVQGLSLVDEVFSYFKGEMSRGATGVMRPDKMTFEARMVWEEFAEKRITEEQALIRLTIVKPL
jgi:hypothetical protein